jgi:hypothetical protein
MAGLAKICKLYGQMTVTDEHGKKVTWVYDYDQDKPVLKSEINKPKK